MESLARGSGVASVSSQKNLLERMISWLSPRWGLSRSHARFRVRHFEAASAGRRTSGWSRKMTDANAAASGATLSHLRAQARDLVRNNCWARRGLQRLVTNAVGWGIRPEATGHGAKTVMKRFKPWGETTECDAAGRLTFFGLQRQVMRTIVEGGEVLARRRWRRPSDGLAIPMQIEVLEPDFLDASKNEIRGVEGGPIIQGVEFDAIGRRVAYWLFDQHPGGFGLVMPLSRRVKADNILHVFNQERAGQVRGTSWFAAVDVRLHDFDEFEDATLMKQKIAACLAAFVTDDDEAAKPPGVVGTDLTTQQPTNTIYPGMISHLPEGRKVSFTNPPAANDHQSFSATALRGVCAGLGVTYEDLTGDYSQVNFSSARMSRLAHYADVHDWRWNMLIPQFCAPAWRWMLEALVFAGVDVEVAPADWTPPAAPMVDPDREGAALMRMVRAGAMTLDQMVREQGYAPAEYWKEYAAGLDRIDDLKIILDSDPRKTTGAGQLQAPATAKPATNGTADGKPMNGAAKPKADEEPTAAAGEN